MRLAEEDTQGAVGDGATLIAGIFILGNRDGMRGSDSVELILAILQISRGMP
jgi:hypothetical protein